MLRLSGKAVTVATITIQNYFRLIYDKLAGMTGTAMTDAEEFQDDLRGRGHPTPHQCDLHGRLRRLSVWRRRRNGLKGRISLATSSRVNRDAQLLTNGSTFPIRSLPMRRFKDRAIVEEVKTGFNKTLSRPVLGRHHLGRALRKDSPDAQIGRYRPQRAQRQDASVGGADRCPGRSARRGNNFDQYGRPWYRHFAWWQSGRALAAEKVEDPPSLIGSEHLVALASETHRS